MGAIAICAAAGAAAIGEPAGVANSRAAAVASRRGLMGIVSNSCVSWTDFLEVANGSLDIRLQGLEWFGSKGTVIEAVGPCRSPGTADKNFVRVF